MSSPYVIVLSGEEEAVLVARARSVRSEYRDRLRASIVLAAAAGRSNAAIAAEAGVCPDTVRKWRRRFAAGRLSGLKDAPRSGRPPVFTAADRAEAVALACALPAESGVPLSRRGLPGTGPRTGRPLPGHGVGVHDRAVAGRRCPQALAAPVLDLRPRPRVHGEGRPRA
jgi:transposase-like protein